MAFQWRTFSVKKNSGVLRADPDLAELLKLDSDAYANLGLAGVDKAYAAYRTAYKAFKNEIKQAMSALAKVMVEQQKTIDAIEALSSRGDNVVSREIQARFDTDHEKSRKNGWNPDPEELEAKMKKSMKALYNFLSGIHPLIKDEKAIQENFKALTAFLAQSKRAQE